MSSATQLLYSFDYFVLIVSFFFPQDYPILWGICAPKQCSEEDVTNAVQDIFSGTFAPFPHTHLARVTVTGQRQQNSKSYVYSPTKSVLGLKNTCQRLCLNQVRVK